MEISTGKQTKPIWQRVLAMLVVLTMVLAWVPVSNHVHAHATEVEQQNEEYCYSYSTDWTSYAYNGTALRSYSGSSTCRSKYMIGNDVFTVTRADDLFSVYSVEGDKIDDPTKWTTYTISVDITMPATINGATWYGIFYGANEESLNFLTLNSTNLWGLYTVEGNLGDATIAAMASKTYVAGGSCDNSIKWTANSTIKFEVEVSPEVIKMYVNGGLARTIEAPTNTAGRFGIYSKSNGVKFDNFRIELDEDTCFEEDFDGLTGDTYIGADPSKSGGAAPYEGRTYDIPHDKDTKWECTPAAHIGVLSCCGKVVTSEAPHEFVDGVCSVCDYACLHNFDADPDTCALCGQAAVCRTYKQTFVMGQYFKNGSVQTTNYTQYTNGLVERAMQHSHHTAGGWLYMHTGFSYVEGTMSIVEDGVEVTEAWDNYTVETSVHIPAGINSLCTTGIILRDAGDQRYIVVIGESNRVSLRKQVDPDPTDNVDTVYYNGGYLYPTAANTSNLHPNGVTWEELVYGSAGETLEGKTVKMTATIEDGNIQVWIDGDRVIDYTDEDYIPAGTAGLLAINMKSSFDYLKVTLDNGTVYTEGFDTDYANLILDKDAMGYATDEDGANKVLSNVWGGYEGEVKTVGHDYNEEITNAPSCEAEGLKTYTCKYCDATKTEVLDKTGHTPVEIPPVDADCTTPGSTAGTKCSVCGEILDAPEDTEPNGHNPKAPVIENETASSCTVAGTYDEVVYCDDCGEEISRVTKTKALADHVEVEIPPVAADCVNGGYTAGTKCEVCGKILEAPEATNPKGHTAGEPKIENNVDPDCDTAGSYDTVVYCSVCGHEISRVKTTVNALGHTAGAPVIENNVEPDCDTAGSYDTVVYCSVCGHEISRVKTTVNALGHDYDDGVIDPKPTCTDDGVKTFTCANCGDSYTETVPALGHSEETIKGSAPTCTATGLTDGVYCAACDTWTTPQQTIPALGHTNGQVVVENEKAADCVNAGSYDEVTYCTVCKVETSRKTITVGALGHTAGAPVIENNVDPDCDTAGSYDTVVYCSVCGHEISRVKTTVNALGHTPVVDNAVAPDCDSTGLTEGSHCGVCGETIVAQQEVPALGHTAGEVVVENAKAADCVNAGSYDNVTYCVICGVETSRKTITVDALGHTPVVDKAVAPDCDSTGLTEGSHCGVCGETIVAQQEVPALGHTKGAPVQENVVDATLNAPGSYDEVVYCSVCGAELSRVEKEIAQLSGAAASVNGVYYDTLAKAIAAANGNTVVIEKDITLTEKLVINGNVVIDLNGKVLTLANVNDNYSIVIYGELTINDSSDPDTGKVILAENGYGIGLNPAATGLTINGGIFDGRAHDYSYIIGAYGGEVTINGGTFYSTYSALNVFEEAASAEVTGGTFHNEGEWSFYFTVLGNNVAVSGGTFDNEILGGVMADGFVLRENADGTFAPVVGTYVAEINWDGYIVRFETLAEAIAAAEEGDTIKLLGDIAPNPIDVVNSDGKAYTAAVVIDKNITLDGQGFTIDATTCKYGIYTVGGTIKNVKIINGSASRAIFLDATAAYDLYLDGVYADGTYALSVTTLAKPAVKIALYVKNSTLLGWLSYSDLSITSATFENCTFGISTSGYGYFKPYVDANVIGENTTFAEGYQIDASQGKTIIADGIDTTGVVIVDGAHLLNGVVEKHSYVADVTDPTCTDKGYTTYTCDCGDEYTDNEVDALGHTKGETVIENKVPAEMNKPGSYDEVVYCSVCGTELSRKTVATDALTGPFSVDGIYYSTFADAYAAADAGDTIKLHDNMSASAIITIDKSIVIDGNGYTLTSTAARAINVETTGTVVINDLTINAGDRAFNVLLPATLVLNNVDATAKIYAVNAILAAEGAQITINNSTLIGLSVVNVAGPNINVEINDSVIKNVDASADENYGAISTGSKAQNSTVVVNGGEVIVSDDSVGASVYGIGSSVTFNGTAGATSIQYIVATHDGYGYTDLQEAIDDAIKSGKPVTMIRDAVITAPLKVTGNVTINGNGCTISYNGTDRAITVENTAAGANLTINDLTVVAPNAQRGINYNTTGKLTLNNVSVTAGTYGVNLPGSSDGATVVIVESDVTANVPLNIWGENITATVTNTDLVSVDENVNNDDTFSGIQLNNDGETAAEGTVVTVNGGSITVATGSSATSNWTATGEIILNNVNTNAAEDVVIAITPEGAGFVTLQQIVDEGYTGKVTLIRDVTVTTPVVLPAGVTLDFNGHTVSGTVLGTLKLNGGLLITAEGYKMFGIGADYYETADAILYMDAAGLIEVIEGSVELVKDFWYTLPGQTLVIGENASFTIPAGKTLNVNGSSVIVNGTVTVDGIVDLISNDATVKAPENPNVITSVGDKVMYVDGVHIVHNHTEGAPVVENEKAADCDDAGSYDSVVYCSVCGEELSRETITVNALGHTAGAPVIENEVAAGCVTEGSYDSVVYCSDCDAELNRETITVKATGHSYNNLVVTPGTCTEAGWIEIDCRNCGGHFKSGVDAEADQYLIDYPFFNIGVKGHTAGETVVENAKAADCVNAGSYDNVVYCSVCGEELSRETITVNALGHTAGAPVIENEVAAGCVTEGSYENVVYCSVCDAELSRETVTVKATGHSYNNLVVTPGTCTEAGWIEIDCRNCGGHFKSGVDAEADQYLIDYPFFNIGAKGHTLTQVGAKAPTCTEAGYDAYEFCSECDYTTYSEIAATGHDYDADVTDPTCTEKGYTTYTCACGDSYVADYVDAKGHDYDADVTDPTCTEKGYTTYTCACGDSYVADYVDAKGHDYDADVTDPTCTEKGFTTYTCSVCGDSYVADYVKALGHTAGEGVIENSFAPTCSAAGGYEKAYYCTVCDAELNRLYFVTDPVGHTIVDGVCTGCGLVVIDGILHPVDVTTVPGADATFSVHAEGEGLTYQWQFFKPSYDKWYDSTMAGATTESITVEASWARNGYQYRCVITDANGNVVTTEAATLTVADGITINEQPADVTVPTGNNAIFTVDAAGAGLTYQWQFKVVGSNLWKNSTNESATSSELTIEATPVRNGFQYRCMITDAFGNVAYTAAATLTVTNDFAITAQPESATVTVNSDVTYTVVANGAVSYQWQFFSPANGKWMNSNMAGYNTNSITLTATTARDGYQYRCVVTDAYGQVLTSDAASLTVESAFEIIEQPASQTVAVGTMVTFSVATEPADGMTYQWQFSSAANNFNWLNSGMDGADTDSISLAATAARNGYKYRCVITDANGNVVISEAATLIVE